MPKQNRQSIRSWRRTIFTFSLVFTLLFTGLLSPLAVQARSLEEIQQEIDKQKQTLGNAQNDLANAEKALRNAQASLSNAQGEVPKLEAEITQIEAQIEVNKLELAESAESQKLKELEHEERSFRQQRAVKSAYMTWRSRNVIDDSVVNGVESKMKSEVYAAEVSGIEGRGVERLGNEITELETEIANLNTENTNLANKTEELNQKKAEAIARIAALRQATAAASGQVAGLRSTRATLQATLSQLSAEQKAVQDYEALITGQTGNGGTLPVNSGQIYFVGRGRDLAQGHGVGMSQYGAKGAADAGWNATQILQFYYRGATVVQYPLNSEITVRYCQGNPALAPYQEGCNYNGANYGPVITERVSFDQYLSGLGEMPIGWHPEARKAQMIAARTYAARYTNNGDPNIPICLTTYCQVSYFKNGNQSEAANVQATKNLVITYGGQLIEALYSADNNQGNGTADHDTRFQNIYGDPTGSRPYLVSVNDNTAGFIPAKMYWNYYCPGAPCGDWAYRTNGYTYAHIDAMLNHVNNNGTYASVRSQVNGIRAAIGNVVAINFQLDGSQRVKKVLLTGSTGQTRAIGGYWFKSIWNAWIADTRPSGQLDYIYSQTFALVTK